MTEEDWDASSTDSAKPQRRRRADEKKDPTRVPQAKKYFLHDDRGASKKGRRPKKEGKWRHDKFELNEKRRPLKNSNRPKQLDPNAADFKPEKPLNPSAATFIPTL